tara:strand:- start:772 stop:1053 length:282 start_codon:yes stop_codon:yes gene_type:complete
MKISDISVDELKKCYDNPNLQEAIVQFVGLVKRFDKTEDEKYLDEMTDIAFSTVTSLPFNEVNLDGEWNSNPNIIMMVVGSQMIELGILPEYK